MISSTGTDIGSMTNQNLCSADLAPLSLPLPYSPRPRLVLKSITSGTPCSS